MSANQHFAIEQACKAQMLQQLAEGEALQFGAMKELQAKGVKLMRWPPEIMKAFVTKWGEVAVEESAKNENFKRVWDSYATFRKNYSVWRHHAYMK